MVDIGWGEQADADVVVVGVVPAEEVAAENDLLTLAGIGDEGRDPDVLTLAKLQLGHGFNVRQCVKHDLSLVLERHAAETVRHAVAMEEQLGIIDDAKRVQAQLEVELGDVLVVLEDVKNGARRVKPITPRVRCMSERPGVVFLRPEPIAVRRKPALVRSASIDVAR